MGLLTFFARRYIAGESTGDALEVARTLNQQGLLATLDILGESVTQRLETEKATEQYVQLLQAIKEANAEADISLKLSMLGLDIDEKLCREHVKKVLGVAMQMHNFVWLDMESSRYTEKTVRMYIDLLKEFSNVGIAIQSYLYRSENDVKLLASLPSRVRLVKGAYKEDKSIAFERKGDVDANYRKLMGILLQGKGFAAIATHDLLIIEDVKAFIHDHKIPKEKFEFQMLYGIRREYWKKLAEGYHLRIYVPFGPKWLPYMLRRLRERKENLYFVLKHLF